LLRHSFSVLSGPGYRPWSQIPMTSRKSRLV
jgi:hypothetical protein